MRTTCVIAMIACLVAASGCGDGKQAVSGGGGSDTSRTTPARLAIQLTQMRGNQAGQAGVPLPAHLRCTRSIPATCTGELVCPATDDAASWQRTACAWLSSQGRKLFATARTDEVCTEIYGGAEVARISGTVDDATIDFRITRTNGCEIGRWELHQPLWGEAAPKAA